MLSMVGMSHSKKLKGVLTRRRFWTHFFAGGRCLAGELPAIASPKTMTQSNPTTYIQTHTGLVLRIGAGSKLVASNRADSSFCRVLT